MKKTNKFLSFMFAVTMFFSVFSNTVYASSDIALTQIDEQEINEEIDNLLKERASIMLSDENVLSRNSFKSRSATMLENKQRNEIAQFRNELEEVGETYSKFRTITNINDFKKLSDSTVSVQVKEETYLTIAETGVETGYDANHEFILEKDINGDWVIVEDKQLDPSGLMPLNTAEEYVDISSEYFNVVGEELNDDGLIPASIIREDINVEEKNINSKAGYNYTAMANYLEKYWSNYNSAYRSFPGNDCTNFVSQALRAGGWQDKPGWYKNSNYWWYNSSNQSWSWTAVDYWGSFARNSGRTSHLSNVWYLGIGDVLQVKAKGSSQKNHTMMVSYVSNGTPYFTYHSTNRYRRSLNQVLKDWEGGTFYAYRT
ncbi:MAG: amidase domain-containing protein [Clostridium sp.]|nr:amidase domain-containing protein [Clostridium sp.]